MDFMKMMKQAKDMQSRMAELQGELAELTVEGMSGGGLVKVTLTGKNQLRGVIIDPSLAKPDEVEILEDLVVAAHADAQAKVEAAIADKMSALTGGLGLPGGFKLPF